MTFRVADLKNALESLHDAGYSALASLEAEFEDSMSWFNDVQRALDRGDLNSLRHIPKTPARKRGALGTINESASNSSQLDSLPDPETLKKKPKKQSARPQTKRKQTIFSDEETDNENDSLSKRRRGTATNENIPAVVEINDTTVDLSNDTTGATNSDADGNRRVTRTRVQRTTIVKETRETFVIENAPSPSEPPVLHSPPPIVVAHSPPETAPRFKSPPPVKIRTISVPEVRETPPSEDDLPLVPPVRMTRTKTRAMSKASQKDPPKTPEDNKSSGHDSEQEGESTAVPSRLPVPSHTKQKFGTPLGKTQYLSHSQLLGTPVAGNSSNIVTGIQSFITKPAPASVKKDRQEDFLQKIAQKTNEAQKKREELIKAQTEERIKKRQEKALKVNAAREAIEKERAEKIRQQLALEEEKRRKNAQQAAEAAKAAKRQQEEEQRRLAEEKKREEERRVAEEKKKEQELLRQAEERKKEEERRRLAEEKRRQQEKRLFEKKQQQEERKIEQMEAELRKKEAEKAAQAAQAAAKPQLNETFVKPLDETFVMPSTSTSYNMTPMPEDRKPAPCTGVEEYNIEDAGVDDSSDDESNPKKEIPAWAQAKNRSPLLQSQFYVRHRQAALFFGSKKTTPDLSKIFSKIDRQMLIRKSSAVWRTPPVKFLNDSVF